MPDPMTPEPTIEPWMREATQKIFDEYFDRYAQNPEHVQAAERIIAQAYARRATPASGHEQVAREFVHATTGEATDSDIQMAGIIIARHVAEQTAKLREALERIVAMATPPDKPSSAARLDSIYDAARAALASSETPAPTNPSRNHKARTGAA